MKNQEIKTVTGYNPKYFDDCINELINEGYEISSTSCSARSFVEMVIESDGYENGKELSRPEYILIAILTRTQQ